MSIKINGENIATRHTRKVNCLRILNAENGPKIHWDDRHNSTYTPDKGVFYINPNGEIVFNSDMAHELATLVEIR